MDFLPQQNRRVSSEPLGGATDILAGGKHVVVIGGGDTGSDCIGTSFRQGAKSVTQLEIMPAPPEHENKGLTWPNWPLKMRTSSSQAEGAKREFAVLTQKFSGVDGKVQKLHCVHVDDKFKPIPGTEFELDAQLVLLAMGFVHPVHEGLLKTLGVDLDPRGNVRANTADYLTSRPNVFSAGDMRRGQSLVVWAIREGRLCARSIDQFLMGTTNAAEVGMSDSPVQTVVTRESGDPVFQRRQLESRGRGVLDAPHARGMTPLGCPQPHGPRGPAPLPRGVQGPRRGDCADVPAAPHRATRVRPASRCSAAIRFSVDGWVENRLSMPRPDSGLMMKRCAVAGLRSAVLFGICVRGVRRSSPAPRRAPAAGRRCARRDRRPRIRACG